MSRDRDGFDDRRDEGAGWQEPAHLGGAGGDQPPADRGPSRPDEPAAWEPPGWSLPPAQRDEHQPNTVEQPPADQPPLHQPPVGPPAGEPRRGLFGGPRRRTSGAAEQVFAYQGDLVGAQTWAVQHGWAVSDGTGPQDAVLAELIATAPVRLTKDHRPAAVVRGRVGTTDLVAFDVVFESRRYRVPEYAVTAAPVLLPLPRMRLAPARFWKHGTGGLLQIPSGDEEFDLRWVLLATEDSPDLRRLVGDPTLRGLLLGSDDGDEFWTAAGHVAAIRPDGHRPSLIEHHARLLGAVLAALAGS
ncbi:hypothetical protein ACI8AF_09470 [Blastococcus sp. SYSU D00669]